MPVVLDLIHWGKRADIRVSRSESRYMKQRGGRKGSLNETGEVNTSRRENQHVKSRKQETGFTLAPGSHLLEHGGGLEEELLPWPCLSPLPWKPWHDVGVTAGWLACFWKTYVFLSILLWPPPRPRLLSAIWQVPQCLASNMQFPELQRVTCLRFSSMLFLL